MAASLPQWTRALPIVGVLAFGPSAAVAQAPLGPTVWEETLQRTAGTSSSDFGEDNEAPEPLSATHAEAGYTLTESVSFPFPGPPNAATAVQIEYQSGLTYLVSTAQVEVMFQFRVRELGAPPVPVSTVPVTIHTVGTVEASGDSAMLIGSTVRLQVGGGATELLYLEITADDAPSATFPPSDAFDHTESFDLIPGAVVTSYMFVESSALAQPPQAGTSAATAAYLDPDIRVADQIIPGTSSSYREFFDIEFSPGYYALGQVPVRNTTWGKIKRLYGN